MIGEAPSAELSRDDLGRVLGAALAFSRVASAPDEGRVLPAVLRIVAEALEVDFAALYLLEDDVLVFGGAHPHGAGVAELFPRLPLDSFTGRHLRDRRAAAYPAEQAGGGAAPALLRAGVQHIAVVPLHLQGAPFGVFHLGRRAATPITSRELSLTQLLANLMVVYLAHARLYTDARRRLDETHMLLEVARTVTASHELDARLEASAQVLAKLIDASNTFVLLLDEDGRMLRGVACNEPRWKEEARRIAIPSGVQSLAWRAVVTRAPVAVVDAASSPEAHQGLVKLFGEKSLLAVPMLLKGEPMGVIVIDDVRAARSWSAHEIERAELIVHQVASAVANARLYDQVKRGYDELARAQAELVKRERLAALGQLAATLAHEVRNPLGVLFNSIGTLEKVVPQSEDVRMLLGIMSEEAQRLERLVRELLDFVRPLTPTLESESLKHVVDGAVDGAAVELGTGAARLSNEVPASLPPVRIDARMMRRALLNLLINGAQAAGPSGHVVVRARPLERNGRAFVQLEVSDDGPGIATDVAPRIFEPFFTTRATGTGLGLAVVKGIVEAHGGELSVTSTPGDGATLAVNLPCDR